jgi:hypothetical protein
LKFIKEHKILLLGFLILVSLGVLLFFIFRKPKDTGASAGGTTPPPPTDPSKPTYAKNGAINVSYDDTLQWVTKLYAGINPSYDNSQSALFTDYEQINSVIENTTASYFQKFIDPLYKEKYGITAVEAINDEWPPTPSYSEFALKHKKENE